MERQRANINIPKVFSYLFLSNENGGRHVFHAGHARNRRGFHVMQNAHDQPDGLQFLVVVADSLAGAASGK